MRTADEIAAQFPPGEFGPIVTKLLATQAAKELYIGVNQGEGVFVGAFSSLIDLVAATEIHGGDAMAALRDGLVHHFKHDTAVLRQLVALDATRLWSRGIPESSR